MTTLLEQILSQKYIILIFGLTKGLINKNFLLAALNDNAGFSDFYLQIPTVAVHFGHVTRQGPRREKR